MRFRRAGWTPPPLPTTTAFAYHEHRTSAEHDQYMASVHKVHAEVLRIVQSIVPDADLQLYGSCLSDLSLGKGADVDLSLRFQQAVDVKQQFESGLL